MSESKVVVPSLPSIADCVPLRDTSTTTTALPLFTPLPRAGGLACREDAMFCERCGRTEIYRMHAVWRCPACGYKTDCCGW